MGTQLGMIAWVITLVLAAFAALWTFAFTRREWAWRGVTFGLLAVLVLDIILMMNASTALLGMWVSWVLLLIGIVGVIALIVGDVRGGRTRVRGK